MRTEPMRPARRAPADIAVNVPLNRLFSVVSSLSRSAVPSPLAVTTADRPAALSEVGVA